LYQIFEKQGRVILAMDGLPPAVGHEVLWTIREVISGEILVARALLSSSQEELANLLREAKEMLPEKVAGPPDDVEPFLDWLSTGLFVYKLLSPLASKSSPHTIWLLTVFKLGVPSVLKFLLGKCAAANSFVFARILLLI